MDLKDKLHIAARMSSASKKNCQLMEDAADEIDRLRHVIALAGQDLSLIVAKHTIGSDRTARRMTKYLHAEKE